MTLFPRRLALQWRRYFAPAPLERDVQYRELLRDLASPGLRIAGAVTLLTVAVYLAYRYATGTPFVWAEDYLTRKDTVGVWDKLLVTGLGLALLVAGAKRPPLGVCRLVMGGFVLLVGWVVVLRNIDPDNFTMTAAWLTLLLVVAVGTVPLTPGQVAVLGLALAAEFWYYARVTPGMVGDLPRLLFMFLATGVVAVVAGVLHAGRHGQFRAVRRLGLLKDFAAARSGALEAALERERGMLERERALVERERGMQQQLLQSEKLASLGRLTAGVAHELKNPLNFVTNFASLSRDLVGELRQILAADPARPARAVAAEAADLLDDLEVNTGKIAEHGRRADAIIRNMLAHSRATPGARRPTDLNRLLDEYVGLAYHGMRAAHSGFNVDIRRDYDPALGTPEVVPEEMGRAFLNLLDNAFDAVRARAATGEPGFTPRVSVATRRRPGGDVEVSVSDDGTGMPEAVRSRIFEPFFTTKPSGQGTGLGLSLAYDIVTQGHGGSVDVASTEGEGTTFTVVLPSDPPDAPAREPGAGPKSGAP